MTENNFSELTRIVQAVAQKMEPLPTGEKPALPKLENVEAVVFDVYGTLLISGAGDIGIHEDDSNRNALAESLTDAGFPELAETADRQGKILNRVIGEFHSVSRNEGVEHPEVEIRRVWKNVLERLSGERGFPDAQIERLALGYESKVNPTWPMPGVEKMLSALKNSGVRLGIVSNAQFYTPLLLETYLGKPLGELGFDPELSVWSYLEGHGKPSPELYFKLRELLAENKIAPERTLYVGNDMLKDIWCAAQAGFKTALFAGDRRSLRKREDDERCKNHRPDAVVTELAQIPPMLGIAGENKMDKGEL